MALTFLGGMPRLNASSVNRGPAAPMDVVRKTCRGFQRATQSVDLLGKSLHLSSTAEIVLAGGQIRLASAFTDVGTESSL